MTPALGSFSLRGGFYTLPNPRRLGRQIVILCRPFFSNPQSAQPRKQIAPGGSCQFYPHSADAFASASVITASPMEHPKCRSNQPSLGILTKAQTR